MSQKKKRWKKVRKEFKIDLTVAMGKDRTLPIAIIETFAANQHRRHIYKIWEYLGFNHPVAYRGYCDKLMGKTLCGKNDLFYVLYFACKELYDKFKRKIPERIAMGDAFCVAYAVMREREKK